MKDKEIEDELEKLRKEIQKKEEELNELKKRLESLNIDMGEAKAQYIKEINSLTAEISELMDSSTKIFGLKIKENPKKQGIFGLINNLVELAEKSEHIQKQFEIDGKEGVIDFHVKMGTLKPTGTPRRSYRPPSSYRRAKTIQSSPKIDLDGEREPIVELLDENGEITVIAELPGVLKNEIKWEINEAVLTIRTDAPDRKYFKEINLPEQFEHDNVKSYFNNGVLKIMFKKEEST